MAVLSLLLNMLGGLALFLFGMKTMSDGLQKSAGDRIRKTLNLMTGNRFVGVITGFMVTATIQSSSATTLLIVSFVNAGLLTLTQAIGPIFGSNIGTTLTGWVISIVGFKVKISNFAVPAIGIGFFLSMIKWKYRSFGSFLLGFGFLFLGLHFLTSKMIDVNDIFDFSALGALEGRRYLAIIIGFGVGLVMTELISSSTASIAIVMTMAFNGIIPFEMAAGMVIGANVGTTTSTLLAGIAGNTQAMRTALAHVMFNLIGVLWVLPLLLPVLHLVNFILPGNPWAGIPNNAAIPLHLAGLHTTYNILNTILFLPFVNQYAKFLCMIAPGKKTKEKSEHYKFAYITHTTSDSPELNILRAEKEISDMAGIVSFMYSRFCDELRSLRTDTGYDRDKIAALCTELQQKETYVDEMRDTLTRFLIDCSREKVSLKTESRISSLLRVTGFLEEMSDECYGISRLLEKSVTKDRVFKEKEMGELIPYVGQVEEFLALLEEMLGRSPSEELAARAEVLEDSIDSNRKKLHKMGRKRIESGKDVRTELLFIDLVRRIEKLGDYCFDISEHLPKPKSVRKN